MHADDIFDEEQQIANERAAILGSAILTKPIGALEHPDPVMVTKDQSVGDAVRCMVEHRVGCVLVEEDGKLIGIFTERDVLARVIPGNLDPSRTPVEKVMTRDPETLSMETKVAYALNKMAVGGYRHVPLVDDQGRPSGVISMRHIVEHIVHLFPNEVLNLPPEPGLNITRTREGA